MEISELIKNIKETKTKPRLLLHCCCGPCASHVLSVLTELFNVTVFFYNPNIFPIAEFEKRKNELYRLVELLNKEYPKNKISIAQVENAPEKYLEKIKGYEQEKEGGLRCSTCFQLRLLETAKYAENNDFEYFTTTLTVSPHKNSLIINEIGEKVAKTLKNTKFISASFKKQDGYKKIIELSKKYNLYRQNYCGCPFSFR